jgi:putative heme transporter
MSEQDSHPESGASSALGGEALGARPGPTSVLMKVLSAALSGGLLVLLFLVIIPELGSMEEVWSAISSIPVATFVVLLIGGLAIRVLLAAAYPPVIPGLSFMRSLIARESSSAVSNVIPGPSGTATQYVVLRSWGVSTERFAGATVSVSVITDALVFAGPGLFMLLWVLVGQPAKPDSHHVWLIGLIAFVVTAITVFLLVAIARSERLAALVGRVCQACVNPLRRVADKPRISTWPDRARVLRADTLSLVRGHATALAVCIVGGYLLNGFLLVGCLWACGITGAEMPMSLGLFLYATARVATIVPITPGAIGVAEVVYTAVYVAVLGEESQSTVVAGVLVYRALTYALPLVTGIISYVAWRVMRRKEIHEAAMAGAPD